MPGHRFWGSDLKIVIDFGRREYKFTTTGCDEDVGHIIVSSPRAEISLPESATSSNVLMSRQSPNLAVQIGDSPSTFTVLADESAKLITEGRFGCAVNLIE